MTSDVAAAVSSAAAEPTGAEERFTLREHRSDADSREQWSLGDDLGDQRGLSPSHTKRKQIPRGLFVAAAFCSLLAIAAVLHLRADSEQPPAMVVHGATAEASADALPAAGGPKRSGAADPAPNQRRDDGPTPPSAPSQKFAVTDRAESTTVGQLSDPATPAVEAPPPSFDQRMREGRAALERGKLAEALAAFQQAAALRPLSSEAITGVARCQAGNGEVDAAAKTFERAVASNPEYAPAWFGLAHLRETAGNRDGAIDAYRRVISISPNGREAKIAREALEDLGITQP